VKTPFLFLLSFEISHKIPNKWKTIGWRDFMRELICIFLVIFLLLQPACVSDPIKNNKNGPKEELIEVTGQDREILTRSEDISDLIVDLYGVDDATTIILNHEAIIAIVLARDGVYTEEMKQIIVETAKGQDKGIKNIYISHDKKIFDQIEDIITGLIQGEPYANYLSDINRIMEAIK